MHRITDRRRAVAWSLALLVLAGACHAPRAASVHVAPGGDDAAAGTSGAPLGTIHAAVARARAGDTILLQGDRFDCDRTVVLSGSGTPEAPLRLQAAPGHRPVLDFSRLKPSDEKARGTARGVFLTGDHWILEGLEICHAPDNGIKIEGSHNRIDGCVFHHNGDSGLQIGLAKKSRNDGSLAAGSVTSP